MKYQTSRYTIRRIGEGDGFDDDGYEIALHDGWVFSDGSHIEYAADYEDLLDIINDIEGGD
jgi:hypothetical protein